MDSKFSSSENIILPEELDYYVQSLREYNLNEIGSDSWMNSHEIILKLLQQTIVEANSYREESVKEQLILHSKLKIFIHEAYCVMLWKMKILPILLEIEPNPSATFLIYTVLFHEGMVITLLELMLFHQNGCESLKEAAIDLIDYCAQAISQLIGLIHTGYHENSLNIDVDDSTITEMERQKLDIQYKIGLRCLSILNYLVDKADNLLLSVGKRMVTTHDIPCLLAEILHLRPWLRKTKNGFEKLLDEKWISVKGENILKVTKIEAQTWFCFRQLLFNSKIMKFYEINDFRRRKLIECQGLLNETIIDQLPPLGELKYFLNTLTIAAEPNKPHNLKSLLLEEIPQIKENIINKAKKYGGYKKIAEEQSELFLTNKNEEISILAKRLNNAYNFDFFIKLDEKSEFNEETTKNVCGNCKKEAEKKCSNCLSVYYCSRDCQMENWSQHRKICSELKSK